MCRCAATSNCLWYCYSPSSLRIVIAFLWSNVAQTTIRTKSVCGAAQLYQLPGKVNTRQFCFFSWHWQVLTENAIIFILWISLHILAYMCALIHFLGAGDQSRREEGIFNAIHQVTEPACWVTWRNAVQNGKTCLPLHKLCCEFFYV